MKQNIWKRWKEEEGTLTGLIGSLPSILFYFIFGSWLATILLILINAYDINMKIEKHAYETYVKYSAWHPEDKKIMEIANDELEHARELRHAMAMIS